MKPSTLIIALLLGATCLPHDSFGQKTQETAEQRDARMAWWRDARFGMFIHFSLCAVPAGVYDGKPVSMPNGVNCGCEWTMNFAQIPVAEYAKYAAQFNPTEFDADEIVRLAKQSGMKYIVQIAKQHDGFAMFDTQASDFNIVDASPFKRDVIREMAEACRKQGMPFGVYYSQAQDWHHPGGKVRRAGPNFPWDPAQEGDYDEYLAKVSIPQVRELLTNYGDLDVFWWDTPQDTTPAQAARLHELLAMQPQIITNDRIGGGISGDFTTPEQFVPATGYPGRDWETCMTMNDTWGFASYDFHYKSTETLLRHLIDIASKGGNFLLNIGPTAEGVVPEPQVERLEAIGRWLAKNGDAIYGTTASVFPRYGFEGRATTKGNTLYIHVFEWPAGGVPLIGLATPVKSATFLADGSPAKFTTHTDDDGVPVVTIQPPVNPDPIATVVALELDGPPQVTPYYVYLPPSDDGSFALRGDTAVIVGERVRYVRDKKVDNIANWTDPRDYIDWPITVSAAGKYRVKVTYSTEDDRAGSDYVVAVKDAKVSGTVAATGGWSDYRTDTLGEVELAAGKQHLTVKAVRMPNQSVMNLQQVLLKPVTRGNE